MFLVLSGEIKFPYFYCIFYPPMASSVKISKGIGHCYCICAIKIIQLYHAIVLFGKVNSQTNPVTGI